MACDMTVLVAERLERVRRSLGVRAHREAAQRALVAIGHAVQAEAERRVGRKKRKAPSSTDNVLSFPLAKARGPGKRRL